MKKLKNGVTMIVLVITIIIMLVLAGTVILSFNGINTSAKQREFATEIHNLQKLVDQYMFLNGTYPVKEEVNFDISSIESENKVQFLGESGYTSNVIRLKKIDLYEAGVETISRGTQKTVYDVYAVSEETGKVYYLNGFSSGEKTYYTLTDELSQKLEI